MRIFVPSAATVLTDHSVHGEGLIAWSILRGLAARGHELVVCAPRVELREEPPFDVVELGRGSALESLAPLAYIRAAEQQGRRSGADLWHWFYPQPAEHVVLPRTDGPFVAGPWFSTWPGGSRRPFRGGDAVRLALGPVLRRRNEHALDQSSALLFATRQACDELGGGRLQARVLPVGIDVSRFAVRPAPPGAPVLFVGRLTAVKGVRDLLDAFELVRRELPDARLVVAGDGPERGRLEERRRELGLETAVELLGPVDPGRMPELLAACSLFCAPSHGEPYGMAVLEAMAAGRAVVSTDAGGPRFLVGPDGGRLVPVGDAPALAAALVSLLGDPAGLERSGRANRERVERELSLERMLDALEAVYAEAVA